MASKDLLTQLYGQLLEQKEVLTEAPALTVDMSQADFDAEKADEELGKVVSYLMGVVDVKQIPFDQAVDIIQTHYSDQPDWKDLLISYLEYLNEKERETLSLQEDKLLKEIQDFTKKLLDKK